jgi:hypothetical protein
LEHRVAELLKEHAIIEENCAMEGRRMVMVLAPGAAQKAKKAKEAESIKKEEVNKEA